MSLVTLTGWAFASAIAMIVISVASLAISLYQMLSYKPPESPVPPPNTIQNIPTAEQGKAIPVLFGTRVVNQPNVVWWGNPHNTPNKVNPTT